MRSWVQKNKHAFERDVLQYFCHASVQLFEQFDRFASTRSISFPVVRAMVGEPMDKGLLWRLKDKAHHVFENSESSKPEGKLLDWALGYIFHESLKLMEDAHQQQYYAPKLAELTSDASEERLTPLLAELRAIQAQTSESMRREVVRLESLLCHTRSLFCLYFSGAADHRPLARFLHDNMDLVRKTFQGDYDRLIYAVYGDRPECMHLEAALSLMESARKAAAAAAIEAALVLNPSCPQALALQKANEASPAQ